MDSKLCITLPSVRPSWPTLQAYMFCCTSPILKLLPSHSHVDMSHPTQSALVRQLGSRYGLNSKPFHGAAASLRFILSNPLSCSKPLSAGHKRNCSLLPLIHGFHIMKVPKYVFCTLLFCCLSLGLEFLENLSLRNVYHKQRL